MATSAPSDALRARFEAMTGRMAANPEMDLFAMRAMLEEVHLEASEPEGVTYAEVDAGGVPAMWCMPLDAAADRVIFYTHGGGFVTNTMHSHRKLVGHLAKAVGTRALVIDYRLAPENPFPAQLEDAVAAYRWLLAQEGVRPEHVATAGDSAGGNLATTLVLKLRDLGEPLPAAIVAFSPWYDMESKGDFDTNAATDALVTRELAQGMATMFLGEAGSPTDPLANPLHADPTGLPPMFLSAGGAETLRDNAERFADKARAAGVDVTVEVTPGMQHVFPFMAGRAPEVDATFANVGAWLRPKLGLGG